MKVTFSLVFLLMVLVTLTGCFNEKNEPPTVKLLSPENNLRTNELTVSFKAEFSDPEGNLQDALWNFGDGIQESGDEQITHTYDHSGDYTVRITVSDDTDQTSTAAVRVSINQAPAAAARAQIEVDDQAIPFVKAVKGIAPLQVKFQGSASKDPDGEIAGYHWDFGDGTSSDEADPSHTFTQTGRFEAVLTVNDNEGHSAQDRVELSIQPQPLSVSDYIESDVELPGLSLIQGTTLSGSDTNKSVLYSYEMLEQKRFSQEEIKLALLDALLNLATNSQISRATIYLFSEQKAGFMEPVDYDHYLGMGEWQRPEEKLAGDDLAQHVINNATISYNTKYLDGSAPTVVGYQIHQSELEADDPRCTICPESRVIYVSLILNPPDTDGAEPAPLCKEQANTTIQAVLQRALMAPGVYGLNIYQGETAVGSEIAAGIWGSGVDISGVPSDQGLLFINLPLDSDEWDINSDDFKLKYTAQLPACER